MRILARIEKVGPDQYLFEGKIYDSFVSARREMVIRMRKRRTERSQSDAPKPAVAALRVKCAEAVAAKR